MGFPSCPADRIGRLARTDHTGPTRSLAIGTVPTGPDFRLTAPGTVALLRTVCFNVSGLSGRRGAHAHAGRRMPRYVVEKKIPRHRADFKYLGGPCRAMATRAVLLDAA